MTALSEALAAGRDRLVAALHAHPTVRDKLSVPEITVVVDAAMEAAGIEDLLLAVQNADALTSAVTADVPTPPPSVAAAVDDIQLTLADVDGRWNLL